MSSPRVGVSASCPVTGSGVCSRTSDFFIQLLETPWARRNGTERSHIHVQYAKTILCSGCSLWSHQTCVQMSHDDFQLYSTSEDYGTLYPPVLHATPSFGRRQPYTNSNARFSAKPLCVPGTEMVNSRLIDLPQPNGLSTNQVVTLIHQTAPFCHAFQLGR